MKYESYEEYDEVRFGTTGGSKEFKRLMCVDMVNTDKINFIFYALKWTLTM